MNSPCPWWDLQCGVVLCWYWTPQRNTAPESRPARARRRDTAAARAHAHARAQLSADRIRPASARYWRAKLWTFDWFLTFWRGFECWLPVKGAGTGVSLQLRHWPLTKRHVSTLNGQLYPLNASPCSARWCCIKHYDILEVNKTSNAWGVSGFFNLPL